MAAIETFFLILIASLGCVGLHEITRDGMIFGFVERFWGCGPWNLDAPPSIGKRVKFLLASPLSECSLCMASIWGTAFLLLMGFPLSWPLIPAVLAVATCNILVGKMINE